MTQTFNQIIEKSKTELLQETQKLQSRKIIINLTGSQFREVFEIKAKKIIMQRGLDRDFVFTNENQKLINQLFYYFTNNDKFEGDQNKGILILGTNGVGKTLILQVFIEIVNDLKNWVISKIHAKELAMEIKLNGYGICKKQFIFVDDIGKESRDVNDFGTKMQPIADFIALRYDAGKTTFATANYKIETLIEFYGNTTGDRIKEMFNIIVLEGSSFRK
jgi:DNA replication protein DnaC